MGVAESIQRRMGMKNSETIVTINKDSATKIFDIEDYGIVGDLFDTMPTLIEEVKKLKA